MRRLVDLRSLRSRRHAPWRVLAEADVAPRARPSAAARLVEAWQHVWRSWRSLHRRELGWFLWFGGVVAGLNLLTLADGSVGQRDPGLMFTEALLPLLSGLMLMLVWLPADRSPADHPRRRLRLAAAVLVASVLTATLLPLLVDVLGLPTGIELAYAAKQAELPGWWAMGFANVLSMLAPSALAIAVIEMARRHRQSRQRLAQAQQEQAGLARAALESRLAVMQAQVEPQFLFDVLVDIERLYGEPASATGERRAALQMARLITYLRVALPRLRESGSTLGAEVDLLGSYLDLVQALRDGRPGFRAELPEVLRDATFHPMLLLPLVQRAVRSNGPPPRQITLHAERGEAGLSLVLDLDAPDLCRPDPELQRLQERLEVLYGGRATLRCEGLADGQTRFTLLCPPETATP